MSVQNDLNKEFLLAQIEEMQKEAWIQSEKARKDIGEEARRNWVKKYAKAFREYWFKKKLGE